MKQTTSEGAAPPRVVIPVRERPYAGISDRLGGLILDSWILAVAQVPVLIVFTLLSGFVLSLIGYGDACQYDADSPLSPQAQYEACANSGSGWFIALSALQMLVLIWVWWRLIAGRMVRRGASIGMSIARLEIEEAHSERGIGALRSLWRFLLASLLPLLLSGAMLFGIFLIVGTDPETDDFFSIGVFVLLALALPAYGLPWLWAIWDRRHQTLYDKFSGTVVVGPEGPTEPWAVASLVCGVLAMFGLVLLGPLALIFGNTAMKSIRSSHTPVQGRGAARAGQTIGVLSIVVIVGALALGAVAWRLGADDRACREDGDRLEEAAEDFREEQGRYPNSDAELVFAGQLDEESDRYEVTTSSDGSLRVLREDTDCPPF